MSTENVKKFSDRLKQRIAVLGFKKKTLAEKAGIAPQTLTGYLNGEHLPGRDAAQKLAEALQCDEPWLLGEIDQPLRTSEEMRRARLFDFRKIPVVSWTTAGEATSYEDMANQIDEFADSTTKDPNAFAVEVVGDSMEGEVHPGDWVILEPNREASSGDMAYVRLTDEAGGGGTLKWFKRTGPEGRVIQLVAENPNWPMTEHPIETIKFAYPVGNIHRRRPRKKL